MSRKNGGRFNADKRRRQKPSDEGAGESPELSFLAPAGRREKRFDMHWVIGTGWIHTHGMAERGYPEVEVRGVPDFLAESAAELIRHVCDYMLDEMVRIKPGETMEIGQEADFN